MSTHFVRIGVAASISLLVAASPPIARADTDLLVSARFGNNILRYDAGTGASHGQFNVGGGLSNPAGLTVGADGNIYASNFNGNQVLRYAPDGTFLGVFASNEGGNGFGFPLALCFGRDHDLYVTSNTNSKIYKFSGANGSFISAFASSAGLNGATGLVFLPGGDLLVSSALTNRILRFDGTTGAFIGQFGSGVTLNNPTYLQLGPDGALYVSNTLSNQILRYDITSEVGSIFATAGLSRPIGLTFNPAGNLLVANQQANNILSFALDGTPLGVLVPAGSAGLNGPNYLTIIPEPLTIQFVGLLLFTRLVGAAAARLTPSCSDSSQPATRDASAQNLTNESPVHVAAR